MRALNVSIASLIALLAPLGVAQEEVEKPTPQQELAAIDARYQAEMESYKQALKEFADDEDYKRAREERDMEALREFAKLTPKPPLAEPYAKEMMVLAEKYGGTEDAVPFLCWVALVPNCPEQSKQAAGIIVKKHAASPQMLSFVMRYPELRGSLSYRGLPGFLERIAQANPNSLVKAYAYYGCLEVLESRPKEERQQTDYQLEHERLTGLVANYGDGLDVVDKIKLPPHVAWDPMLDRPAPEFGGVKLDSWGFDKRQFEGKILVACFWNNIYPACDEQLANINELAKRWSGAPVVVVGYNTNPEIEVAQRYVEEHKIEWPMIHGGVWGRYAEVPVGWGIGDHPTTIVIDDLGVLREMVVGPADLNQLMERLIIELEARAQEKADEEAGEEADGEDKQD